MVARVFDTQRDAWVDLPEKAATPRPATEKLLAHAERFGCDCVYATVERSGFSDPELAVLGQQLRAIAERHRKARKPKTWWRDPAPAHLPQDVEVKAELAVLSAKSRRSGRTRKSRVVRRPEPQKFSEAA
jgi:hypothetical protein